MTVDIAERRRIGKDGEERVAALLRSLRFHVERPRYLIQGMRRKRHGASGNENGTVDWLASKGNVRYAVEVKTTANAEGSFILRAVQMERIVKEYPDYIPALALVTPDSISLFVLKKAWDATGSPIS